MYNVYILSIVHLSTYSKTDTYIDSVYYSEQKAWERIEVKYKELIKIISKTPIAEIQFAEFREKSFIVRYSLLHNEVVYVKYIIDKYAVH